MSEAAVSEKVVRQCRGRIEQITPDLYRKCPARCSRGERLSAGDRRPYADLTRDSKNAVTEAASDLCTNRRPTRRD